MKQIKRILLRWLVVCCFMSGFNFYPAKSIEAALNTPEIPGKSVVMIDRVNGQILYQKDRNQPVEAGSISKLLAVYVAYKAFREHEAWNESTYIDISDQAYELSQDYNLSNVPLRQDMNYTIDELVESIAVGLANGSTLALAEFIAGDEASYVKLMEQQLDDWGIQDYELFNCTGLPRDGESGPTNRLSAEAAATIAYHLVQDFPRFTEYSKQAKSYFKPKSSDRIEMLNYNYLIPGRPEGYEGVKGLMPGFSEQDGASLVTLSECDEFEVIIAVLGTEDTARYQDTVRLIEYANSAYRSERVIEAGQMVTQIGKVSIEGGDKADAPLQYAADLEIVMPIVDTLPRIKYQFNPDSNYFNESGSLTAPLEQGTEVGQMHICADGLTTEFIPSGASNNVSVALQETISEGGVISQFWNRLGRTISDINESIRHFFVNLFN